MNGQNGQVRTILMSLVALLLTSHAVAGVTSVTLNRSARLGPEAAHTLSEIALIEGDQAAWLGAIPIDTVLKETPEGAAGWKSIELDDLKMLLQAQDGLNWGRLSLRGSTCQVRVVTPPKAPVQVGSVSTPEPQPLTFTGSNTIGALVADQIRMILGAEPEDFSITFNEQDEAFLGTSLAGRLVEARPVGSGSRVPIEVVIYDRDEIIQRETIRVEVQLRREIALARVPLQRGDLISSNQIKLETRWVSPDELTPPLSELIGQRVRGTINAGATIAQADIEPPIVIKRGDPVVIHCVTRTVVIRQQGRALEDAHEGELFSIELVDKETKHKMTARAAGVGRAVVRPAETYGVMTLQEINQLSETKGTSR